MSRDEKNLLITTYFELKHFLDQSFQEIVNAAQASKHNQMLSNHSHLGTRMIP